VTIGKGVTNIGTDAFYGCDSLNEVYNRSTLNIVAGADTYGGVSKYASIVINSQEEQPPVNNESREPGLYQTGTNNRLYSWQELLDIGVVYVSSTPQYPKGMYIDPEIAYEEFDSLSGDLVLPNDGSIETMGFEGFAGGENVTSVIMPDSVRFIQDGCLSGCKVTKVVIGANVELIAEQAFAHCTSLTTLVFNGTVAQWNSITFERNWNLNLAATEVICTDGVVNI
jgi:hypothetical protein